MRLLSFLADVEHALAADDPEPQGGTWENLRSINYHQKVARLSLGTRDPKGHVQPLGAVTLQAFELADGTSCLKAYLSWAGSQSEAIHAVYARPDLSWTSEARRIAAGWLNAPVRTEIETVEATSALAATG